ncbi:MAG: HEAT repeat domain-containing protein [Candidatus Sulfopaludibacter sp.]|nr:HEAT repeat domain-containing protein [Candidatus Sulfopaludibacter sp.]
MIKQLAGFVLLTTTLAGRPPGATDSRCTDMLKSALSSHNPDTRKEAVVALSLASERSPLLPLLVGMAADKDVQVRLAVVASLAEVKSRAALEALEKLLKDPVPEVSFAAAKALWNLHDPAGKQALLSVVQGETKTASSYIPAQMRQALRMMHTPATTFLYAMRQGIGFVPVPGLGEGIASMQSLLTDPGISGRATAVLLLGKDRDPALVPALKDAMYDQNWTVRAAAVHSLAVRNDPALKKDLAPMLDDEKEGVRLRAAAAYLRLSAIQVRHLSKPASK